MATAAATTTAQNNNRDLKQRRRRRQRERHEFANLVSKNNIFACPARAFFNCVHFFAVVSKTTIGSLRSTTTTSTKTPQNNDIIG